MNEVIVTPSAYTGLFALLCLVLGFLVRDFGMRRRIKTARSEGTVLARTSIDGGASLLGEIEGLLEERDRLRCRVEALTVEVNALHRRNHDAGQSLAKVGGEYGPDPMNLRVGGVSRNTSKLRNVTDKFTAKPISRQKGLADENDQPDHPQEKGPETLAVRGSEAVWAAA